MKKPSLKIVVLALLIAACNDKAENRMNDTGNAIAALTSSDKKEILKNIHIMAEPDSIAIDNREAAIIVVDMQNDFGSKGGMFDRWGINISIIQKVISPTAKVLAAAREAGIKIIYLKMGFHEDLSDVGSEDSEWHVGDTINAPNGSKGRILIREIIQQ